MGANFNCPQCGCPDNKCVDSRPFEDGIRRKRVCIECGYKWRTYELSESGILECARKMTREAVKKAIEYSENQTWKPGRMA